MTSRRIVVSFPISHANRINLLITLYYIHTVVIHTYMLEKRVGPWSLPNIIDYVVFPIGLVLDPDNVNVWLSYGRQVLLYVCMYCMYVCTV